MNYLSIHVKIYGRVQGVFFRQSTYEVALQNNITGYVRNRLLGFVEAEFEGEDHFVHKILEWCHHGPPQASVQGVEILSETRSEIKKYSSFRIESTI